MSEVKIIELNHYLWLDLQWMGGWYAKFTKNLQWPTNLTISVIKRLAKVAESICIAAAAISTQSHIKILQSPKRD